MDTIDIAMIFADIARQVTPYVVGWVISQYAVRTVINAVTRGKVEV